MLEEFLHTISELSPIIILCVVFFAAYIENIFPPSPSDVIVVFCASVLAAGESSLITVILLATLGSTTGFVTMYYLGKYPGSKVIRSGKLKFITPQAIKQVDEWFSKYGYSVIIANRFLPGTRAVISFFAGLHHLKFTTTLILASVSALLWNTGIIYLGYTLGNNVQQVDKYLKTYSNIILICTVFVIVILVVRYLLKRKKRLN